MRLATLKGHPWNRVSIVTNIHNTRQTLLVMFPNYSQDSINVTSWE